MNGNDARSKMAEFWRGQSHNASIEEVMLDDDAEALSKLEIPEIMSYLPHLDGRVVLELGAGIGRFTTNLAAHCRHVLAVDFMESFIKKNKEINARFRNIDYLCRDITELSLEPERYDLIFTNWLLMYLDEQESVQLLCRALSWLKEDGHIFIRESCYQRGGNKKLNGENPTFYRNTSKYTEMFSNIEIETANGTYGFRVVHSKPVLTYIKVKYNSNQITWLLQKVLKPKGKK